jgi:DNA topoisomerase IA
MPDLFVIEAPGKAKHILEILKSVGFDARVQATKGHMYSMPDRLTPVGIDSGFREFERKLREPEIGQRIRDEAANADRVFIATDADEEGDVIAWDVAELIVRCFHETELQSAELEQLFLVWCKRMNLLSASSVLWLLQKKVVHG